MNTNLFNTEAGLYLFLLFLFALVVYLAFGIIILIYFRKTKEGIAGEFRKISVIISARNEGKNIPLLIDSLSKQTYPKDKFEVILIDDNSEDNTAEIARSSGMSNLKVISAKNKKLPGKKGALVIAIEKAENNFIAVTDADCFPEPEWLNNINLMFERGYDVVVGAVLYTGIQNDAEKYSAFEHYRNLLLVHSLANLGKPYSASAGNFAFTKKIFDETGGYDATLQTVSGDDDLFVQNAVRQNAKVGSMLGEGTYTYTKAPSSFGEHFNRKRRHVSTSLYYSRKNQITLAFWYISAMLLNASIVFIYHPFLFVFPLTKVITELILFSRIRKVLKLKIVPDPVGVVFHSIRFDIFTAFIFVSQFFVKTKWKGN